MKKCVSRRSVAGRGGQGAEALRKKDRDRESARLIGAGETITDLMKKRGAVLLMNGAKADMIERIIIEEEGAIRVTIEIETIEISDVVRERMRTQQSATGEKKGQGAPEAVDLIEATEEGNPKSRRAEAL
jgi:hypothetical protein